MAKEILTTDAAREWAAFFEIEREEELELKWAEEKPIYSYLAQIALEIERLKYAVVSGRDNVDGKIEKKKLSFTLKTKKEETKPVPKMTEKEKLDYHKAAWGAIIGVAKVCQPPAQQKSTV